MTATDHFQEAFSTPGPASAPPGYPPTCNPSPGRPARSQWPVIMGLGLIFALALGVAGGALLHPVTHTKTETVTNVRIVKVPGPTVIKKVTRTVSKPVTPAACIRAANDYTSMWNAVSASPLSTAPPPAFKAADVALSQDLQSCTGITVFRPNG